MMSGQVPDRTDPLMIWFILGFTTIYCVVQLVAWAVTGGAS